MAKQIPVPFVPPEHQVSLDSASPPVTSVNAFETTNTVPPTYRADAPLDDKQRVRAAALRIAREVLVSRGIVSSSSGHATASELIVVARYIELGSRPPW